MAFSGLPWESRALVLGAARPPFLPEPAGPLCREAAGDSPGCPQQRRCLLLAWGVGQLGATPEVLREAWPCPLAVPQRTMSTQSPRGRAARAQPHCEEWSPPYHPWSPCGGQGPLHGRSPGELLCAVRSLAIRPVSDPDRAQTRTQTWFRKKRNPTCGVRPPPLLFGSEKPRFSRSRPLAVL